MTTAIKSEALLLVSKQNGIVVIPAATPLTRLNYFDGKFLRASDLKAEQDYLRQLVRQSNQAGGSGVAHGFDVTLAGGDSLEIGPGLAIDPQGRVLLLPQGTTIGVQDLIEKSRDIQRLPGKSEAVGVGAFETCELIADEIPVITPQAGNLYLIVVSAAEALCGEEDVFGKLCEEACATSTDRPFAVEGVIVRALPLVLRSALPNSKIVSLTQVHLRSRVASSYFEDERRRIASLISKFGLEQETWCLGAEALGGSGVPIGVIARAGSTTIFLDAWTARRERIDSPAKRYWQWRMMMRPWDIFLAQILQFQCQLHDLFKKLPTPNGEGDPCGGARGALDEAAVTIAELRQFYEATTKRFADLKVTLEDSMTFKGGVSRLTALNDKLVSVGQLLVAQPPDRLLIRGGIVELPSAGYLPVVPGANVTINKQVRQLMGEGVDLRFCIVRPDYVAHALEEAQHMERISLLQGLDDPKNMPEVDILVPNGQILEQQQLSLGRGFEASVDLNDGLFAQGTATNRGPGQVVSINTRGAARSEVLPSGGGAVYLSSGFQRSVLGANLTEKFGLWMSLRSDSNVFALKLGDTSNFNARAIVGKTGDKIPQMDVECNGVFQVTSAVATSGTKKVVKGRIDNAQLSVIGAMFDQPGRKTTLVDLQATVSLTGGDAIEILLDHASADILLSANWDNKPLEVKAAIVAKTQGQTEGRLPQEIPLLKAALKENPDILSAKNAEHIKALDALQVVAASLGDLNFADAKARLLFPPPPAPTDELLVRATLDWVLFHRRRTKKCSEEKLVAPAPGRRYQLWMGVAANDDAVKQIAKALADRTPISPDLVFFTKVDTVEFGPGAAALTSRPEDIKTDWSNVKPGERIAHGAIASQGAALEDGTSLAQGRLERTEQVVASISKTDGATLQVLSAVHPDLVVPNVDGVIVLVTLRELKQTCHSVHRIIDPAQLNDAIKLVIEGKIDTPQWKNMATKLGNVSFKFDTLDVLDNSMQPVIDAWNLQKAGEPVGAAVEMRKGYPEDNTQAIQLKRALAIQKALGGKLTTVTAGEADTTPDCPMVTLIAGQPPQPPTIGRILFQTDSITSGKRFFATTNPAVISVKQNPDGTIATGLTPPMIAGLKAVAPNLVGLVELAPSKAPATPQDTKAANARLDAIFAALGAAGLLKTGAKRQLATLLSFEQNQLDLGGGAKADDLIYLQP